MIYGNVEGVKNYVLEELEKLYDLKFDKQEILNVELVTTLCKITNLLDREVSAIIDRKGTVNSIYIGDSEKVDLPLINIKEKKLSGLRVIHTHPSGNSNLSILDKSALIKLKLDAMVAIGTSNGELCDISIGFIDMVNDAVGCVVISNISLEETMNYNFINKLEYIEKIIKDRDYYEDDRERAILIGSESMECLNELEDLAEACGVVTLEKILQNIKKIDASTYIGSGKVSEVTMVRQATNANLIIFDDELSGSQVRNLEETIGCKVIDRTTLILEIFSRRAKTKDGKIQVELAQLKYRLPRLTGLGVVLSRTGGGIGTKGPGEKKLEIDKRHIRDRIYELNKELEKFKQVRENQREKRKSENIMKVSLVGYTNAGKSTLRNLLCKNYAPRDNKYKEEVFAENMLFATLDTTTRAIVLLNNETVTLTDTVGFIRKLPHDLIEAFKSTLEEVIYSDLLVHVLDISSKDAKEQLLAVEEVLKELGATETNIILAYNKIDRVNLDDVNSLINEIHEIKTLNYLAEVKISAAEEININELLEEIEKNLPIKYKTIEILIPYDDTAFNAYLHRNGRVISEEYNENGTLVKVEVDDEVYNKSEKYIV